MIVLLVFHAETSIQNFRLCQLETKGENSPVNSKVRKSALKTDVHHVKNRTKPIKYIVYSVLILH